MGSGPIKVLAGDFNKDGRNDFLNGMFVMQKKGGFWPKFDRIGCSEIVELEVASEENVKKLWGTVGSGAIGAVLLGPVGLLAGALVGGKRKEVTFVCKFKDGRKLLATTKNKKFLEIQAAVFDQPASE